jgi:hypothetical protein
MDAQYKSLRPLMVKSSNEKNMEEVGGRTIGVEIVVVKKVIIIIQAVM